MTENNHTTPRPISPQQADEVLIVDPTRGEETEGMLRLFRRGGWRDEGYIAYRGQTIDMAEVKEVTFHNTSIPYLPNTYQVVITSTSPQCPNISIPAGSDASTAMRMALEIERQLFAPKP